MWLKPQVETSLAFLGNNQKLYLNEAVRSGLNVLLEYGCPEFIVTDNAKVFNANDYQHILKELEVEPKYIEKGKPWQNLIEAQFKVQLRIADFKFEQAQTVEEVQNFHAEFVDTFNTTTHYAHQERNDDRKTPMAVLAWVRGRAVDPQKLQRLFRRLRFFRTVNRFGFVSVQRFYIYAEQGLSRKRVSIRIYEGRVHIEYQETLLAQYQADYDQKQKRLQGVSQPTFYQTPFVSPQLVLFELDDEQWLKVRRRSYDRHLKPPQVEAWQLPLAALEIAA